MKKNILNKVCIMLLAAIFVVACGNGKQSEGAQQEGAKTEAKASKSGKAKKAKNNNNETCSIMA